MNYLLLATLGLALWASSVQAAAPSGSELFLNHCAACHGATGEGDGPVATTMSVNVPNLRTLATRNRGAFPAEDVTAYIDGREIEAAHGDRRMPIWGNVFRGPEQSSAQRTVRRRIAALVAFIETLQYR